MRGQEDEPLFISPYYEADGITIYNADARDIIDTLTYDVVVTDPPYHGREDLFPTDAVIPVLTRCQVPAIVFWPVVSAYPLGDPDAVHIWHKSVPIHPRSEVGNVAGHQYERILAYGFGRRCEVYRIAAIMPNFAACRDELTEHPTQKPLTLMRRLVDRTTGVVLDPFMGSGTTLRAAADAGRRAIGIEVEERWCEVAVERLAQGSLFAGMDVGYA